MEIFHLLLEMATLHIQNHFYPFSNLNKNKDTATQKRTPFLKWVGSQDGNVHYIRADAEYPIKNKKI